MNVVSPYSAIPARRFTSALHGYPTGIGYANRTFGTSGFVDDFLNPLLGNTGNVINDIAKNLIGSSAIRLKEQAGYRNTGELREIGGKVYVKMQTPAGMFVLVGQDGVDIPFTSSTASGSTIISSQTGLPVAAIGIGLVAVAAILFFTLRNR